MSHFEIDLQFKPMVIAEDILNTLYTETSAAIDKHNLVDGFCNIYIPVNKKVTVFAECRIDMTTADVKYFVVSSKNTAKRIPALDYKSAVRTLRQLMVG
jgi:hypothetical protein